MDPNATLKQLLDFARSVHDSKGDVDNLDDWVKPDDAREVADLIEALDNWLRAGGFLPRRWQPPVGGCGMRHHAADCSCGGSAGDR